MTAREALDYGPKVDCRRKNMEKRTVSARIRARSCAQFSIGGVYYYYYYYYYYYLF